MTITREQVADLRAGDVVELTKPDRHDVVVRGSVTSTDGNLFRLGTFTWGQTSNWNLAVVSRAPRPFYVNHSRTAPVPGDVVRGADDDRPRPMLLAYADDGWISARSGMRRPPGGHMPDRLRLLVDGETGQIVP